MRQDVFSLTNLYIFLIEFGFSLLFLLVFASIHYGLIKSTRLSAKLEKSKVLNFWYFFLFGFILSLFTFIVSQVSSLAFGAIGMPLTILGLIYAMTIFYNRSVQIGAIIPTVVWVLYQYNGFVEFNWDWVIRLIIVLIMAGIAIGTTFIKWKPWPTFLISCATTLILLIVVILSGLNEYSLYYSIVSLIAIAATIFYYAVVRAVNKWLTRMSTMAKQGAYIDKYYLIPTVFEQYFNDFIKTNNCSQALVVSIVLEGTDSQKSLVLSKIHSLFENDKSLLFKSTYGTYGFVLTGNKYLISNLQKTCLGNKTISRLDDDNLKSLETQLKKINLSNFKLLAYVSIYGVHSCNVDSLLKRNHYLIKHDNFEPKQNIIQVFNTDITTQDIKDEISFATLSQRANLNDINVELELIKMTKSKTMYACPRFYWAKMLTCNIDAIMSKFESSVANTLLRHLAIKSLEAYANNEHYHKYPLLLYYPVDQLNTNTWSSPNLIKKIKMFGINNKNIILLFSVKKYKDLPDQIRENLIDLELHNINYFLIDVRTTKVLRGLTPQSIILDSDLAKNVSLQKSCSKMHLTVL